MSLYQNTTPLVGPLTTDPPFETQLWRPSYPDHMPPRVLPRAHYLPYTVDTYPYPTIAAVPPGGTSIATGATRLWQYLGLVGPLTAPPAVPDVLNWQPRYPDAIRTPKRAAWFAPWQMDKFTAPTAAAVPDGSWQSTYPRQAHGRPKTAHRAPAFHMDTQWTAPVVQPSLTAWQLRSSYVPRRPRPVAPYTWAQPHFGVELRVPVMSWTGCYLDPPVRRQSRHASGARTVEPITVADVTISTPTLSWQGRYPATVPKVPRSLAALLARGVVPVYLADVTVVAPILSATATYSDKVWPRVGVRAPQEFSFDARYTEPDEIIAPDMAQPVYPDRVYGKPVPTDHPKCVAPEFVLDVTLPAPALSWAPVFPAQHLTPMRAPEYRSYTNDTIEAPLTNFRAWFVSFNTYRGPWDKGQS
jgi:hypothetical protein